MISAIRKFIKKLVCSNVNKQPLVIDKPESFEIKKVALCKEDINSKVVIFFEEQFSVEAKNKINNKKWILRYCIKKAWIDATISERFKKDSLIIKNKENIICFLEEQLHNNHYNICRDFNYWHNSVCESTIYNMRYGVWQKLINMTFKYLYCVKTQFPEFSAIWHSCHCPIDTIIAKQIYNKLKDKNVNECDLLISQKISKSDKNINWNNITKQDYLKLQNQIKSLCIDMGVVPIEFDFLYWGK